MKPNMTFKRIYDVVNPVEVESEWNTSSMKSLVAFVKRSGSTVDGLLEQMELTSRDWSDDEKRRIDEELWLKL